MYIDAYRHIHIIIHMVMACHDSISDDRKYLRIVRSVAQTRPEPWPERSQERLARIQRRRAFRVQPFLERLRGLKKK